MCHRRQPHQHPTEPTASGDAVANGGFEDSGHWTMKNAARGALTYNFVSTNSPYNGLCTTSIVYQGWFDQVVTLAANTRYNFSRWTQFSTANARCIVNYNVDTASATQVLKTKSHLAV